MNQEIEIIIETDGTVKIEGHGFEGPACALDIDAIARELGQVEETVEKAEYLKQTQTRKVTV